MRAPSPYRNLPLFLVLLVSGLLLFGCDDDEERTIELDPHEFDVLSSLPARRIEKTRYYYDYAGRLAEVDVFHGALKGLVVVEFEFGNEEDKDSFEMPEFCLADVTQDDFIAAGRLCGKSYDDIKSFLDKYGYAPIRA